MHHLLEIWVGWVRDGGYIGIIVLMAMESSIFPVPSEIVIPPAAFLAARGDLSFTGVILAGTFGLPRFRDYLLGFARGRTATRSSVWKYFFVPPDKFARAEIFMHRYEAGGIFFARLLPVIRHLISIPAGIVRMNFWIFSLVTIVGSALWCAVLAYLGDKAYRAQPDLISNPKGSSPDQSAIPLDRALCGGVGGSLRAGAAAHSQTNLRFVALRIRLGGCSN
jgi:membrane protein DedA with SNARE-associated domain